MLLCFICNRLWWSFNGGLFRLDDTDDTSMNKICDDTHVLNGFSSRILDNNNNKQMVGMMIMIVIHHVHVYEIIGILFNFYYYFDIFW